MASTVAAKVWVGSFIGALCGAEMFARTYCRFIQSGGRNPSPVTLLSAAGAGAIAGGTLGYVAPIPVIALGGCLIAVECLV